MAWVLEHVREDIRCRLDEALRDYLRKLGRNEVVIPRYDLDIPTDRGHGDFATNVAMIMSKPLGLPARKVAEGICERLSVSNSFVKKVEIAGPGFINFFLDSSWQAKAIEEVLEAGPDYGRFQRTPPDRVLLEFVSANPTGPLNVVNARAGVVGDVLANLLEWAGDFVCREFYINDAGSQVALLGESLEARLRQLCGESAEIPENGYHGDYLIDLARELQKNGGLNMLQLPAPERRRMFTKVAVDKILEQQRNVLERYGVQFNNWFSERSLHESGKVKAVADELAQRGCTYTKDGAVWFKSSILGDDKDRVLIRKDGTPTYLAADLAYHKDKFQRGFNVLIDIWGPDHHGYIARTRAGIEALGFNPENFQVLIVQMVRLVKQGEVVRMSKRAGEFVSMEELLDEVGVDVSRFFFLLRSPDSHLDFDLDLAKLRSEENPVYYVQYAHARIASILRRCINDPAVRQTIQGQVAGSPDIIRILRNANLALLTSEPETVLIRRIAEFPGEIKAAAAAKAPHRMTRFATELATEFHSFYTECRVLGNEPDLTLARLALVKAAEITLKNVLRILGVSAPESM